MNSEVGGTELCSPPSVCLPGTRTRELRCPNSSTQDVTSRGGKASGREQPRLSSLLPVLQQLQASERHWQLLSHGSQTHSPPDPRGMASWPSWAMDVLAERPCFLSRFQGQVWERKQASSAMWETLTCHARPCGNLRANATVARSEKDRALGYLGWL